MAICLPATWKCRPRAESKVEKALGSFVASTNQNELKTQIYTALQQLEDATNFMTNFIFENEASRAFNHYTAWVKEFTHTIYLENIDRVVFT